MAGCGANSTAEAINLAKFAKSVGADCQLQVVPYYNKPTQEGHVPALQGHRRRHWPRSAHGALQRARPHRGRHALETVLRLAQLPGIVGIKEATGNIERATG